MKVNDHSVQKREKRKIGIFDQNLQMLFFQEVLFVTVGPFHMECHI